MAVAPLRQIVETFNDPETGGQRERLECGHVIHRKQDAFGYTTATRRRCPKCLAEAAPR